MAKIWELPVPMAGEYTPEGPASPPTPPQTDQPDLLQSIQQYFKQAIAPPEAAAAPYDPTDYTQYGVEKGRYAAKNKVSQGFVNVLNQIPGVDLLGNATRRVMDAYLGNPNLQAAKLRVLDETGQAKAAAAQQGSQVDFMQSMLKTIVEGSNRAQVQSQADAAAATRSTNEIEGADRRAAGVQAGSNARTERVATQKTEADNLLLAMSAMKKWGTMSEQERTGTMNFIKRYFPDYPIGQSEVDGLTWLEEKWRKLTGTYTEQSDVQSPQPLPTGRGKVPGTKGEKEDELGKILFGGGL